MAGGKAVACSFGQEAAFSEVPASRNIKGIQQRDCTGFSPVSLFTPPDILLDDGYGDRIFSCKGRKIIQIRSKGEARIHKKIAPHKVA